jgi:uroporphyrin-III C-methyltransferase/precorrin-2 dehydrogenase/sirohydrochlorin ferrochelatase
MIYDSMGRCALRAATRKGLVMDFFPAFLKIEGRPCLVVGGGDVAERKVRQLTAARGQVTVVSPALTDALAELAAAGAIVHRQRTLGVDDLADAFLVIAATDDAGVNRQVAELAKARNVPVNVVDQPALCTFIVPSSRPR